MEADELKEACEGHLRTTESFTRESSLVYFMHRVLSTGRMTTISPTS